MSQKCELLAGAEMADFEDKMCMTFSKCYIGMSAKQVQFLFELRNQIKLYHWQTEMHSRHMATDKYLTSLDEHIDLFVEVYMGKYGRPKMTSATNTMTLRNFTEKNATIYVKSALQHIQGPFSKTLNPQKDTDLLNIRDEIMGDLNQLAYLFTLR